MVVKIQQIEVVSSNHEQRLPLSCPIPGDSESLRHDRDRAEVEEHVIVGTQAEDVVHPVASIVWPPEWANMCCLRVGRNRGWQRNPADLTRVVVDSLDLSRDRGIANDPLDRLSDALGLGSFVA
jgi:hypothetical protein